MLTPIIPDLLSDETGATAIEYGLIAGLVSVAAITAMTSLGDSLNEMFEAVAEALDDAVN
jgi:pilus assembly protein Flp/PilA